MSGPFFIATKITVDNRSRSGTKLRRANADGSADPLDEGFTACVEPTVAKIRGAVAGTNGEFELRLSLT